MVGGSWLLGAEFVECALEVFGVDGSHVVQCGGGRVQEPPRATVTSRAAALMREGLADGGLVVSAVIGGFRSMVRGVSYL